MTITILQKALYATNKSRMPLLRATALGVGTLTQQYVLITGVLERLLPALSSLLTHLKPKRSMIGIFLPGLKIHALILIGWEVVVIVAGTILKT
jgi:hypothetical protein